MQPLNRRQGAFAREKAPTRLVEDTSTKRSRIIGREVEAGDIQEETSLTHDCDASRSAWLKFRVPDRPVSLVKASTGTGVAGTDVNDAALQQPQRRALPEQPAMHEHLGWQVQCLCSVCKLRHPS